MPHETVLSLSHKDGYTAEVRLRRGGLAKASAVAEPLSPCSVKADTDAVLPFELQLTNTTPNYSASPVVQLELRGVGRAGDFWFTHDFLAVVRSSRGSRCVDFHAVEEDSIDLAPAEPLATSRFVRVSGWFIVEGYYPPATPHGDPTTIREVIVSFFTGGWNVSTSTGAIELPGGRRAVPLDPQSDGGCWATGECS